MIPKFRVFDKVINQMFTPDSIHFDSKGMVDGVGSKGTVFGIEDFELMQSTGLKDINDKEIYEGDIIVERWENFYGKHERITVIEWNERENGWNIVNPIKTYTGMNYEIIGNIHEHSHLLDDGGQQQ